MTDVEGFDYAWGYSASLANSLAKAGAKFVVRYIGSTSKCLTANEIKGLHAKGIAIGLVYETTGLTYKGGRAAGQHDGAAARAAAEKLGVPKGVPIWFAIDTDTSDYATVKDYLFGASLSSGNYPARIYGSYKVVEKVGGDGHWQTYAWSGSRVSKHAGLYQYHNGVRVGGVDMDKTRLLSTAAPAIRDGWLTFAPATPAAIVIPTGDTHPVVAPTTVGPVPVTPAPAVAPAVLAVPKNAQAPDDRRLAARAWMRKESAHPTRNRYMECLRTVRIALNVPAGADWAIHAWDAADPAYSHTVKIPEAGTPYFFKGAGKYGHIVLVDTPGHDVRSTTVWSTDIKRKGKVDLVTIGYIEDHWGMKGLGWTTRLNGVDI